MHYRLRRTRPTLKAAALWALLTCLPLPAVAQEKDQRAFPTPEAAVDAMVAAIKANDRGAFTAVVGSALDQIASGDNVQDNLALLTFSRRLLARANVITTDDSSAVLYAGRENVLFPLPLQKGPKGWFFDVEAGKQKILDKRIGLNELRALEICRLYVRAQKKYVAEDRDGDGVLEYATRFLSTPGTQDGLYWPRGYVGSESPFGPLMSLAKSQGYQESASAQPFQGYNFRILKRQGASAPGGSKDFVASGNMKDGFAAIAYPARWGVSGVMTFMVGPEGNVFEKNLGKTTDALASSITEFNPDESWSEVKR